jgi:hypothetical protein
MDLFQQSLVTNLKVALTLQPIEELFLMNHQDCGAFKAFLPYSGYPSKPGDDNVRELEIQGGVLTLAHAFIQKTFPDKLIRLTLIDLAGSVAQYNIADMTWTLLHKGRYDGQNENALWYGMNVGDVTTL